MIFELLLQFLKRVMASAAEPAKPTKTWPPDSVRTLVAPCLITVRSPKVTWPSPASTTWSSLRTAMMVVELIFIAGPPVNRAKPGDERGYRRI